MYILLQCIKIELIFSTVYLSYLIIHCVECLPSTRLSHNAVAGDSTYLVFKVLITAVY